jgi:hypothetical protein
VVTVHIEADITTMALVGALHTGFRNGTLRRKIFFVGQAGSKSSYSCGNVIKLDWTGLSSPGQIGRSATLEVPLWTVQTINQQVKHHLKLSTCLAKLQTVDILLGSNNLQHVCKQSPTLKTCTPLRAHTPLLATQHIREKESGNEPPLGFWGDLSQRDSFIEWNKILNVMNEVSLIIWDDGIEIILIRQIV